MDHAEIMCLLGGASAGLLAGVLLKGGILLSLYRHKIALADLQGRVLTLYNRGANFAARSRNTPTPEELAQLMQGQKQHTRKFDNDPFSIER